MSTTPVGDGTDPTDRPHTAGPGSGSVPTEPPVPGRPAGRRPRPIFFVIGIVVAVALAIGLFTGIGTNRSSGGRPQAGSQVPGFSLPKLGGGGTVAVPADGGGNGRPAVLLFFASWCGPCQKEIPMVAATYRKEQASHSSLAKVALVGVDGSDPTANALAFVHKSGVTFPVGADRTYSVTEGLFAFTGLPAVVFVNGNGTIAAIQEGGITTAAQLVAWQHRLLSGG